MTRSKNTRRALLTSALSMLLCVSMLVGSTFAWFTDSVTSGKNQIVAGNLDVELEYSTDGVKWEKVEEETDLFKADTLWEPGHTEYVYLRVSNVGTLALKYNLNAAVFGSDDGTKSEAEYTNMKGDKVKLSSYLVFNLKDGTEKVENRKDLWLTDSDAEKAAMGKLDSLNTEDDVLYPVGDKDTTHASQKTFTLAVYMPTSVGNEANWIGAEKAESETAPTIYLGLMLNATQTPYESDSFNENYDETAELPKVTFNTEELRDALHEGGNILLGGSTTLLLDTKADTPGDKGSISSDEMVTEDVSIDLNGHTMLAAENQAYDSASSTNEMFSCSNFSMKNGTYLMERVKDNYNREASRAITFRVGEEGTEPCNISFENVIFKNEVRHQSSDPTNRVLPIVDFALRGYEETTITFKNCEFYDACVVFDDWNYRYVGEVGPTIVFDNCTFNVSAGTGSIATTSRGSVIVFKSTGYIARSTNLTIRDCTINYTSTDYAGPNAVNISDSRVNVALEGHNVLNGIAATPYTADESKGEWKNYDDIYVRTIKDYDPDDSRYKNYDNEPFVRFASSTVLRKCTGLDTLEYKGRAYENYPKP